MVSRLEVTYITGFASPTYRERRIKLVRNLEQGLPHIQREILWASLHWGREGAEEIT